MCEYRHREIDTQMYALHKHDDTFKLKKMFEHRIHVNAYINVNVKINKCKTRIMNKLQFKNEKQIYLNIYIYT